MTGRLEDLGAQPGSTIVILSWGGTVVFTVAATAATIWPEPSAGVFVSLSVAMFGVGVVAFLWSYAIAVSRSRTDAMGIGGLYFLQGSAPAVVQLALMASLGVEVAVALLAATLRIYTPVAFGILVPVYGLGLAGLWGARFGTFPPRAEPDRPDGT